MEYTIISDYESGENGSKMELSIEREEVRNLVSGLVDHLRAKTQFDNAVSIRTKKSNPVLKNNDGDKVYFKWSMEELDIDFGLSSPEMTSEVVRFIRSNETGESDLYEEDAGRGIDGIEDEDLEDAIEEAEGRRPTGEQLYENIDNDLGGYEDAEFEDVNTPTDYDDNVDRGADVRGERTEFTPMYEKDDVDYVRAGKKDQDRPSCEDCVHFIEGGGCHMVRGEIEEDGICGDLYADIGVFGRVDQSGTSNSFTVSLASYGDSAFKRIWGVSASEIKNEISSAVEEVKEFTDEG